MCSVVILKDTKVCANSLISVNILNVQVPLEEADRNSKYQMNTLKRKLFLCQSQNFYPEKEKRENRLELCHY